MSVSNSRTPWVAAMVAVTVLFMSEFHLLGAGQNEPAAKDGQAEKGRTWQGQVVERGTFKPIAGVEVVMTLSADEVKAKPEPEYRRNAPTSISMIAA